MGYVPPGLLHELVPLGSGPAADYSHGESHFPESVSLMLEGYGRWP